MMSAHTNHFAPFLLMCLTVIALPASNCRKYRVLLSSAAHFTRIYLLNEEIIAVQSNFKTLATIEHEDDYFCVVMKARKKEHGNSDYRMTFNNLNIVKREKVKLWGAVRST